MGTPQFQLGHFGWAVVDEIIHDILLTQPVATRYCIVKVIFEAVMILRDSGGAPSAATVWLRIGYTFEISAIFAFGFACAAAIAARNPAPPAPTMARSA